MLTDNLIILFKFVKQFGMLLFSLFPFSDSFRSFVNLHIEFGRAPSSELCEIKKDCNFVKLPTAEGSAPDKLFPDKSLN